MSIELLGSLLALAVVDSLNPSAITVALLLVVAGIGRPRAILASVAAYVAGIFAAMVAIGIALMFGLRIVIDQFLTHVPERTLDIAQFIVGLVVLTIGAALPTKPKRPKRRFDTERSSQGLFVLGLAVTVVELSSAFPFMAAIGLLTQAEIGPPVWLPAVFAYSLVTVLPPLLVMLVALVAGRRIGPWAERNAERLRNAGRGLVLTIIFLFGLILAADAAARLNYFGLLPN